MRAFEFHIHIPTGKTEAGIGRLDEGMLNIVETTLVFDFEHDFHVITHQLAKLVHVLLALDVGKKPMLKTSVTDLMYLFKFNGGELVPEDLEAFITDM